MAREFSDVLTKILNACPGSVLHTKLEESVPYWAPEILWYNLTRYVNNYMTPNSKDDVAVKVYAILCDKTEEEMRADFVSKGY